MTKLGMTWFQNALIRAVRTAAQVALSYLTVGMTISEVDWKGMLSVTVVAAVYSLIMSVITGLPEADTDGTLLIDETAEDSSKWLFQVEKPLEDISKKSSIQLNIKKK